jgi:AAA15 family ATPase/GTPase
MRFANFLSYKDETIFYMTATPKKELHTSLNNLPIFHHSKEKLLKASAIYGANGSGKSNILKAFQFFVNTILNIPENFWQNFSSNTSNPFLLNSKTRDEPSSLEISFFINNIEYRYGFEILNKTITQEWLYKTQQRETKIFLRDKQNFDINGEYNVLKQLGTNKMIPEDALLLPLAAKFNDSTCRNIINYFKTYYFFDSFEITSFIHGSSAVARLKDSKKLKKVINLLRKADTGIQDIKIKSDRKLQTLRQGSKDIEAILSILRNKQSIISYRNIYDDSGNIESIQEFLFSKFESEGTRKFFDVAAISVEVLENGGVLFVDEIDTKFHPLLTQNLLKMFYNRQLNPKNAQIVFTTHDISLLDANLLRRDQVWFTEKDRYGVSRLFSLSEYRLQDGKGVRNDEAFAKNYLQGKYGAIPIIEEF